MTAEEFLKVLSSEQMADFFVQFMAAVIAYAFVGYLILYGLYIVLKFVTIKLNPIIMGVIKR